MLLSLKLKRENVGVRQVVSEQIKTGRDKRNIRHKTLDSNLPLYTPIAPSLYHLFNHIGSLGFGGRYKHLDKLQHRQ